MDNGFISIKQMMQHMNGGLPFSISFVTYDVAKGKGGAVKNIAQAVKLWAKDVDERKPTNAASDSAPSNRKNPHHFFNSTVNIKVLAAGGADIKKVHVPLIRRFNGKIVK